MLICTAALSSAPQRTYNDAHFDYTTRKLNYYMAVLFFDVVCYPWRQIFSRSQRIPQRAMRHPQTLWLVVGKTTLPSVPQAAAAVL
jgi:hypothetical protein